jgi:hypothetical protein
MKQLASLKVTNAIVYILSILGAAVALIFGSRTCVYDCEYTFIATYVINVEIIAFSIAAVLFSTLVFQVVNVFALHVEKSLSK